MTGTTKVKSYSFQRSRYIIHLVDTPGFNDTNKSDTDILNEISIWLAMTYRAEMRLTGIVYLHRISDNRMTGSAVLNLNMFKKLCGERCLPNVVLATTMWSTNPQEKAEQEQREVELITNNGFWGSLIEKGAKAHRHDGTLDSAINIISLLENRSPIVLDIQRQIADEGRILEETPAGEYLREDIIKKEEENRLKLEAAREQLKDAFGARDERLAAEMSEQINRAKEQLAQAETDRARLRENLDQRLRDKDRRIRELAARSNGAPWAMIVSKVIGGLGVIGMAVLTGGASLMSLPMSQLAMELGNMVTSFAGDSTNEMVDL
jgi:hypothetical protein